MRGRLLHCAILVGLISLIVTQSADAGFYDTGGHLYEDAINFVQEEEIVEGYADGTFKPDAPINRAEFVKIVVLAALPDEAGSDCFPDVGREWFAVFVCTAKDKGFIGGYPDGTFKPDRRVNFVEAAKILSIAFKLETQPGKEWYTPYVEALRGEDAIPPTIARMDQELTRGEMAAIIYMLNGGPALEGNNEETDDVSDAKGWQQRIDAAFASSDCPKVTWRRYGDMYYDGPLIDTHFHIANIPDASPGERVEANGVEPLLGVNLTITNIVCNLRQEGTKKVFAFFPVYPEIHEYMLEVARRAMELYPDYFVPFIMPPDQDNDPDGFPTVDAGELQTMLDVHAGLFRGYGEIGLYERKGGGAPALPPDSKRLSDIYPIIRKNKIVVYFHLGEGQKESFERTFEENPDIQFIFHGDQLIPYENGIQNLDLIEEIIREHPNVYYTVDELWGDEFLVNEEHTKEEYLKHLENYDVLLREDVATWKRIIEKYPDQFMWGTDRSDNVVWNHDPDVGQAQANYGRAFIARLSPAVQEKFAYKNAEALLAKAAAMKTN